MRRIAVFIGVLVVLAVVADAGLRVLAENRAADQIETSLELNETPEVSLGGWPFVVQFIRGRFPSVIVSAEAVGTGALRLSEVELELERVRVSLLSDKRSVRARSGMGTAAISERALNAALDRTGVEARVEMSGEDVTVIVGGDRFAARPSIEGGDLVIQSSAGPSPSLDLPEFAAGVSYRSVSVSDSMMVVTFELTATSLELP